MLCRADSSPNTVLDISPFEITDAMIEQLVEGMDIIDKIANVAVGSGARPIEEVKIIKASII